MRQGEGGDRHKQALPRSNENDEGGDEEQVINPAEYVLETQAGVADQDLPGTRARGHPEYRIGWAQPLKLFGSVGALETNEDVCAGGREPLEFNRLADQAPGGLNRPPIY